MSGSGNQIQLVARGNIDASITGNPSITFFKSVYRKHTNFSMEDMIVDTISKPLAGHKYPVKIPTGTGDLLYGTNYILKGNSTYCGNGIANISTAVIDNIAFVINSREIDKTYGHYLEVYHELNQENPNSTITNLGRIEDSSLYHIAHNADISVQATHKSMINNNRSDTSYFDNALSKPTNIMGHGLGYPPTHFQRMSKCGGTYCSPSYLQEQNASYNTYLNTNDTEGNNPLRDAGYSSNYNYVASINNRPTSSGHVSGMNRNRFHVIIKNATVFEDNISASFTYEFSGLNQFIVNASYTSRRITGSINTVTDFFNSGNDGKIFNVTSINGNEVTISSTDTGSQFGDSGSGDSSDYKIEFTMTAPKIHSANLLNASQISESINKGDILGDCTVPLNFWYCKSPGLAIPLCALHKSVDVELYMQFAGINDADWTKDGLTFTDKSITYDQNINNTNDIVNAYKIGNLKGILTAPDKFNFDVDIAVTYIYLDNMERKRFSQSSHEYLIEQLQFQYENGQTNKDVDISSFQHPVKELIWTGQPYLKSNIKNLDVITSSNDTVNVNNLNNLNNGTYAHKSGIRWVYGNTTEDNCLYGGGIQNADESKGFGNACYVDTLDINTGQVTNNTVVVADGQTISDLKVAWTSIGSGKFVQGLLGPSTPDCLDYVTYKLKFNSTDRCQPRPLQYFTRENVYKYHKGGCISVPDSIAVYSFALNPTDTSPSGTCNFSNIDDIKIERGNSSSVTDNKYKKINVYAINYNILRIVNGQAGISYF